MSWAWLCPLSSPGLFAYFTPTSLQTSVADSFGHPAPMRRAPLSDPLMQSNRKCSCYKQVSLKVTIKRSARHFLKAVAETKGDHEGAHRRCKRITWAVLSGSCPRGVQSSEFILANKNRQTDWDSPIETTIAASHAHATISTPHKHTNSARATSLPPCCSLVFRLVLRTSARQRSLLLAHLCVNTLSAGK